MNVGELMNRSLNTCGPEDSLWSAAQKMWEHDIGSLPVVETDGRLLAMITDRDICMAAFLQGRPLSEIAVRSVMSREVYACRVDDALIEAEETMRARQVHRLPVLDAKQSLVGVISLNDLAREAEREAGRKGRELSAREVTSTLAAVSTPRQERSLIMA